MKRLIRLLLSSPQELFRIIYYNIILLIAKIRGIKTIVYNLHHDYFFDIFESVYNLLKNEKNIRFYFSYKKENFQLYQYLRERADQALVLPNTITPFINFDLFICPEVTGPDFPFSWLPTKTIQIYHGIGNHNLYEKIDVLNRFDIHFAIGPHYVKFIKFAYQKIDRKPQIYKIGYPKLDILLQEDPLSKKLKKLYNLKDKKTILYAPHWNEFGSIHKFQEELIRAVAKFDVNVLIKPHNYLYAEFREANWQERLQNFAAEHDNITLITRPNTQELYPISDIVITDTGTTTGLEFSLTYKPLLIYCNKDWFRDKVDVGIEIEMNKTSFCFQSLAELDELIEAIIKERNSDGIEKQRQQQKIMIENYLFNPGKATEKAAAAIRSELKLDK